MPMNPLSRNLKVEVIPGFGCAVIVMGLSNRVKKSAIIASGGLNGMENEFNFSEWLVNELEKSGISSKQLAKEIGLSYTAMRYYITEERMPSLRIFILFLDYFNKHIEIVDNGGKDGRN